MVEDYKVSRARADSYLPEQRKILGPIVGCYYGNQVRIADYRLDRTEATDLTVLRGPNAIGLRVRSPSYRERYGLLEFTIRAWRDSGAETELAKITKGHGEWSGYFHADDVRHELPHWLVVDLDAFRRYVPLFAKTRNARLQDNKDGTYFKAYRVTDFPVGILIAASNSVCEELPHLYQLAMKRRQAGEWNPDPTRAI